MGSDIQDVRSRDQLIEFVERGARPKYVFFWGHTPKVPGRPDQSCLSNWFPTDFVVHGVRYPTAEHCMMAGKARLFDDDACLEKILGASSPGAAKQFGREVRNFDEARWVEKRFEIVVEATFAKFSQNEELAQLLVQTGTKVLVEASPRDRIWGIGMGRENPKAADPRQWNGLNLLGFALMETRTRLTQ